MARGDECGDVTQLLIQWRGGDRRALDQLIPLVYDQLREIAGRFLRRDSGGRHLQTTELVHEAYVRLIDQTRSDWQSRAHFFGVAATIIRNLLVDHARSRRASKRGGAAATISLDEALLFPGKPELDLIAVDDALLSLARLDPQQEQIVELRFFAGLTIEETADVLQVSTSTVKRDWVLAKTWIFRELSKAGAAGRKEPT